MLIYDDNAQVPSEQECFVILQSAQTPPKVIEHCKRVAELSWAIGSCLIRSGCQMNLDLIKAAALLHDIAKGKPSHAQTGADMLMKYPDVAQIVAEHTDICLNPTQPLTEKEIIYLTDKLVSEDRIITIRERFAGPLERYKNDSTVTEKIRQRLGNAEKIQTKIEDIIKMPLHDIWKAELGRQTHGRRSFQRS